MPQPATTAGAGAGRGARPSRSGPAPALQCPPRATAGRRGSACETLALLLTRGGSPGTLRGASSPPAPPALPWGRTGGALGGERRGIRVRRAAGQSREGPQRPPTARRCRGEPGRGSGHVSACGSGGRIPGVLTAPPAPLRWPQPGRGQPPPHTFLGAPSPALPLSGSGRGEGGGEGG